MSYIIDAFVLLMLFMLVTMPVNLYLNSKLTVVDDYLRQSQAMLDAGTFSDGCTTPFKTYIHRWLKKSKLLCAAHDYGSRGNLRGVQAGWHNNWIVWLAHVAQPMPVYWAWGTVVAVATLPYAVWRYNFKIKSLDMIAFHILFTFITVMTIVIYKQQF